MFASKPGLAVVALLAGCLSLSMAACGTSEQPASLENSGGDAGVATGSDGASVAYDTSVGWTTGDGSSQTTGDATSTGGDGSAHLGDGATGQGGDGALTTLPDGACI